MMGASGGAMSADILLLREYLYSHDTYAKLDKEIGLSDHYKSNEWDIISRAPFWSSEEDMLAYYRNRLEMVIEPESGVMAIFAEAFTKEYSLKLTQALLMEGIDFVNRVGQEIALEEIKFVEKELAKAEAEVTVTQRALIDFQAKNKMLSPDQESASFQSALTSMKAQLVQLRTDEKAQESYLNDGAPSLIELRARMQAIEQQIVEQQGKISGSASSKINEITAAYRELEMKYSFAMGRYTSAVSTLELTKVASYRKPKHLVTVQRPVLPDENLYPSVLYNLVSLFMIFLLSYGIGKIVVATIKEHRDV